MPTIDPDDCELEVEIESSGAVKTFSLKDLKSKFEKTGVVAVVMCGGNRRMEMNAVKEVRGLPWSGGACGNAAWEGVRLCDLLSAMGVKSDEKNHVILEGYDRDPTYTPYVSFRCKNYCFLLNVINFRPHRFPCRRLWIRGVT